jgi:hypothetical protein
VKKVELVKIRGDFDAETARLLRGLPRVQVIREGTPLGRTRADALVEVGENRTPILIETKAYVNAGTARQLLLIPDDYPARPPLVIVARKVTADARQWLAEHDVGVIDALGNADIELPGLILHVQRSGPEKQKDKKAIKLAGKSGLVAQRLLMEPHRRWNVNDLCNAAHVSIGLTHRVLDRLTDEGFMEAQGKGPNRTRGLANPPALLDLWAEEDVVPIRRTTGFVLAQTPTQLAQILGQKLGTAGVKYAITGAAAANLLAPFITAVPVTDVWVDDAVPGPQALDTVQADPVERGHNIALLQTPADTGLAFRELHDQITLANRFRIYADLRRDPRRGKEQAEELRREVIGF